MLKNLDLLITEKTSLTKKIKADEIQLIKDIEDRIERLTYDEIDKLMYEKWFGTFVEDIAKLSTSKLIDELDTLKMLDERYSQTLDDIDNEIAYLMKKFESMQQELVVL